MGYGYYASPQHQIPPQMESNITYVICCFILTTFRISKQGKMLDDRGGNYSLLVLTMSMY
jgi:hypothetical protein